MVIGFAGTLISCHFMLRTNLTDRDSGQSTPLGRDVVISSSPQAEQLRNPGENGAIAKNVLPISSSD